MVELLIGFVCFCGLSLLNASWSTVPLSLPLLKFFCKEGADCTSCYVAVGFFLVLQNRTIGFEIKSLQCWVFLTPVYLGKNNGKTLRQIVSSLYCIALYDNYIALNDKVQK
jgi:hypothetical protein